MTSAVAYAQQPPHQQDEREVKARELFGFRRYAEALAIYGTLYAETAHPTYLRNIGRCYQNLGDADNAIGSFREYLRQVKSLSLEQRAVVEGYIREMQELKQKQQASGAPSPTAPAATSNAPSPSTPAAVSLSVLGAKTEVQGDEGGGGMKSRRTASYLLGAASLVTLGVGGFFGIRAISRDQDRQSLCPADPCSGQGLALSREAKSDARVADFVVGAGLIGAGVAAYLFFTSSEKAAPGPKPNQGVAARLHILPELGPERAGLVASASW
jgi:hypothetical protein